MYFLCLKSKTPPYSTIQPVVTKNSDEENTEIEISKTVVVHSPCQKMTDVVQSSLLNKDKENWGTSVENERGRKEIRTSVVVA